MQRPPKEHWIFTSIHSKAGMSDAAWCAQCTWAPLRWQCLYLGRYNKCSPLPLPFALYVLAWQKYQIRHHQICFFFKLKMHQNRFWPGVCPVSRWGRLRHWWTREGDTHSPFSSHQRLRCLELSASPTQIIGYASGSVLIHCALKEKVRVET